MKRAKRKNENGRPLRMSELAKCSVEASIVLSYRVQKS